MAETTQKAKKAPVKLQHISVNSSLSSKDRLAQCKACQKQHRCSYYIYRFAGRIHFID